MQGEIGMKKRNKVIAALLIFIALLMTTSLVLFLLYIISFCLLMISILRILWLSFFERTGSYAVLILRLSFGLYYAWMCILASWPRKVEEDNSEKLAEYIHLDHFCGESVKAFFKHLCEE